MKRLGDVAIVISGQHVLAHDVSDTPAGLPYLTGPSDFVGMEPRATSWTQHGTAFSEQGDTLLTVKGSGCGTIARSDQRYAISRQLMAIRSISCDGDFLWAVLETQVSKLNAASAGTIPGLSREQVIKIPLPALSKQAQRAIGRLNALSNLACAQLGQLLSAKHDYRRIIGEALISGRIRLTTRSASADRRCAEGAWMTKRLGEHAYPSSDRNRAGWGPEHVQGVFKDIGLAPMRDHVRAADLRCYKVLPIDGFAYNPMRLNIGSIARNTLGTDCLVSPDYVVFQTDAATLAPQYLDQVRRYSAWRRFVRPAGSGSVRMRIYFRDLAKMRIALPSIEEQREIAATLELLDREIALLEQLRDAYAAQKRGLMQRLLAGDVTLPTTLAHA